MGRARQLADGGLNDAILMDASAADTDVNDNLLLEGTDSSSTDAGFNLLYEDGTHDASVALTPSLFTLDSLSVSGTTTLSSSVSGETTFDGAIIPNAGIKFPATQVASTDANTLDDYEEGTWTPTVVGGGTAGTYETSTASGFYQKIGRDVTVRAVVQLAGSISAGGTGSYHFGGLPFNLDVSDNAGAGTLLMDSVDINRTASGVINMAVSNPSGTDGNQLRILQMEDNAGFQPLTIAQAAASDFFEFVYNYRTTA